MKHALILSPFATAPLDAGPRRRVFQMTELLSRRGYRITLLVHAFEAGWREGFDDALYKEMASQWDEVIVFHAGWQVGHPPANGRRHRLDEWWNPELGTLLTHLLSRRCFDVFVVHRVWLSRGFEAAPPRTIKVLDTHGLSWPYQESRERLNSADDGFMPSREEEESGIGRADLAVVIRDEEADQLAGRGGKLVVAVPFFDAELERASGHLRRTGYLGPDKIVFGFSGSAGGGGGRGIQAVLEALEQRLGPTPAPLGLVVGGDRLENQLRTSLPLQWHEEATSAASLHKYCDVVVAVEADDPDAGGGGLRVTKADCLALGVPVLTGAPEELAARMVEISLARPDLAAATAAVAEARADLRQRTSLGGSKLVTALKLLRIVVVLDLRAFDIGSGVLPLIGYLSLVRLIAWRHPVIVILADELAAAVSTRLPTGASALAASAATPAFLMPLRKKILDASGTGPERLGVCSGDAYAADRRWLEPAAAVSRLAGGIQAMPLLHPDIFWEPAVADIRRRRGTPAGMAPLPAEPVDSIVFVDHLAAAIPSRVFGLSGRVWMLNTRREAEFDAAVLWLLEAGEGTVSVVWAGSCRGIRHRLVLEVCALRRFVFHGGTAEGAVLAEVPHPGDASVGERVWETLHQAFATPGGASAKPMRVAA